MGRALSVEGGYQVTGRWPWASSVDVATWALGQCHIYDGEVRRQSADGVPEVLLILVPKKGFTVLNTWHTGGMRGTGSADFEVSDYFLPAKYTLPIAAQNMGLFGVPFATIALGVARASIDAVVAMANKPSQHGRPTLRDRAGAQYEVARCRAMIESARMYLVDAAVAVAGARPLAASLEQRARLRRAQVLAAMNAQEAVDSMYRVAGGTAVSESAIFERSLRDVHAILAHVTLQRELMEDAGRAEFGLEPRFPIF